MVRFAVVVAYLLVLLALGEESIEDEQVCSEDGTCVDHDYCEDRELACPKWASEGLCTSVSDDEDEDNKFSVLSFMLKHCARSCENCGPCQDYHDDCGFWAKSGECDANPNYMLRSCRVSCKICDDSNETETADIEQMIDPQYEAEIYEALENMETYLQKLRDDPETTVKMHILLDNCVNRDSNCAYWKVLGECEANPAYMKLSCAPVCNTCDLLDINKRCPIDPNAYNALRPGDLNQLFVNLTTLEKFQKYKPTVLSRPDYVNGDSEDTANYQIGPWVVTLEDFVSPEEAERLIKLGGEKGYERSSDVGKVNFDGSFESDVNEGRTSMNAWCDDDCEKDELTKNVVNRIEEITNIPYRHSEQLQLLRYEVGQFYQTHHDYIEFDVDRPAGPRLLTVFLYLNDVEAGGGTNFPGLDITVMPKLGRVLIWPSVLDEEPNEKDWRTDHQALPVEKGIKYGANAWIHMRDQRAAHDAGC